MKLNHSEDQSNTDNKECSNPVACVWTSTEQNHALTEKKIINLNFQLISFSPPLLLLWRIGLISQFY
jgi:hypothetical protein